MHPLPHPLPAASRAFVLGAALLVNVCGAAGIAALAAVEAAAPKAKVSLATDRAEACEPRQRVC